jgi:hypothetical protein
MIEHIDNFRNGNIGFGRLVKDLEGAFDAGEFKDRSLIESWYKFWTPLEIRNAAGGEGVVFTEVASDVSTLEVFLQSLIDQF